MNFRFHLEFLFFFSKLFFIVSSRSFLETNCTCKTEINNDMASGPVKKDNKEKAYSNTLMQSLEDTLGDLMLDGNAEMPIITPNERLLQIGMFFF